MGYEGTMSTEAFVSCGPGAWVGQGSVFRWKDRGSHITLHGRRDTRKLLMCHMGRRIGGCVSDFAVRGQPGCVPNHEHVCILQPYHDAKTKAAEDRSGPYWVLVRSE